MKNTPWLTSVKKKIKNNQNFGKKPHKLNREDSFLLLIIFTNVLVSSGPIYLHFVSNNLSKNLVLRSSSLRQQEVKKPDYSLDNGQLTPWKSESL